MKGLRLIYDNNVYYLHIRTAKVIKYVGFSLIIALQSVPIRS